MSESPPLLRDIIIGFSDGLTVPFALTAGLSSLGSARLVIMGGLAELLSGMLSMGLGAYLAAATEANASNLHKSATNGSAEDATLEDNGSTTLDAHGSTDDATLEAHGSTTSASASKLVDELTSRYPTLSKDVARLFVTQLTTPITPPSSPPRSPAPNYTHLQSQSQPPTHLSPLLPSQSQSQSPTPLSPLQDPWLRKQLSLSLSLSLSPSPTPLHPYLSGLTMGLSYFIGGLIPMLPYFFLPTVHDALVCSVAITLVVLLAFGYAKNYVTLHSHRAGVDGALQTLAIGLVAAGSSYAIVKLLDAGVA